MSEEEFREKNNKINDIINCLMYVNTFSREYYDDLEALSKKSFPHMNKLSALRNIINYIVSYKQMWHDVRNADPKRQSEKFRGRQALYIDEEHKIKNTILTPLDYLKVFKEYMRIWAARKNTGSPVNDWYKMQDELAEKIRIDIK